jgi:hypothetical protein
LVCLQETKLDVISDFDVIQILGSGFDYVFLPMVHTWGGILLAWRSSSWVEDGHSSRSYSLLARVRAATSGPEWWLTTVYEPSREADKLAFLTELQERRQLRSGLCMLADNFKIIYRTEDKNNARLNWWLMGQFW